ncbi:Gastrokine-3 [Trichinella pseudospiralis]
MIVVERNSERECRHVHTFFGRKAVHGTDLTDQTSCFDRKLCALIGAVKPAIFAPLEPEGGLMIRSLLVAALSALSSSSCV